MDGMHSLIVVGGSRQERAGLAGLCAKYCFELPTSALYSTSRLSTEYLLHHHQLFAPTQQLRSRTELTQRLHELQGLLFLDLLDIDIIF